MTAEGREYVHRSNRSSFRTWLGDGCENDDPIPLPPCERVTESVDLDAEGLGVAAIERRLHVAESASETGETTPLGANATENGAPTGGGDDADEAPSEAVASITARLNAIEAQLAGTTLPARVIDTGEGVTLLRVFGEGTLTHGETVEVTVRDGETAAATDDGE